MCLKCLNNHSKISKDKNQLASGEMSIVIDVDSSVKANSIFSLICGSLSNIFLRV